MAITNSTTITSNEQMILNAFLSAINLYIGVFLTLCVFMGLDTMSRKIDEWHRGVDAMSITLDEWRRDEWRKEMTYTSLKEGPDLPGPASASGPASATERWIRLSRRNRAKAQTMTRD
jgi:hypothetical protein